VYFVSNFGFGRAIRKVMYEGMLSVFGVSLKRCSVNVDGLEIYLIPSDVGISRELKVFKMHEPLATSILRGYLRRGMRVIDVGSNIGYYCLLEARAVGCEGRVVAIEPNPLAFRYLLKNIRVNSLYNVIPKNLALWNADGFVDFVVSSRSNLCYVKGARDDGNSLNGSVIRVPAKTLDNFFNELSHKHNFCCVNLIRMDLEGGEWQVFEGAREVVKSHLPIIFMELHVPAMGREKAKILLKNFSSLGYSVSCAVIRDVDYPIISNPMDIIRLDMDELSSNPPLLDLQLFLENEESNMH